MNHSTRRQFMTYTAGSALTLAASPYLTSLKAAAGQYHIPLGGPVDEEDEIDPERWAKALSKLGYRAAYWPVEEDESDDLIMAYKESAQKERIIIGEVGAWSNPISPDTKQQKEAIAYCQKQLTLADRIDANCCVNIAGSRKADTMGDAHPDNLTSDTFDLIVEVIRKIIDGVKPKRTFYALETMPWVFPDSIDSYVKLIKAIDRKQFAAHFDPVNLVNSPERYFTNGKMIKYGFEKLGPYIKSCHAKDIVQKDGFPIYLQECQPGKGKLDYKVFLKELSKLKNVPLILEHLESLEEYKAGATYIRKIAKQQNIGISQPKN